MPRPAFGHKLHLTRPGSGTTTVTSTSGLHQPFLEGNSRYYGETFVPYSDDADIDTSLAIGTAFTAVGPMFTGGPRSWDRIGFFIRFSSAPGTSPDYYFVVYALDDLTLLPTALLYQSAAARQPGGTVSTWEEDTITLDTTASWLGVGFHFPDNQGESIAYKSHGVTATGVADRTRGYVPYGHSRTGDGLFPGLSIWAGQAAGTDTAAAPSAFAFPAPVNGIPFRGTGVYMRLV